VTGLLERLRHDRKLRAIIVGAGAAVLLLVATQFVFSGDAGPSRGTPAAILFNGVIAGMTIAVFAVSMTLVYRTMRFVNFAIGPLGFAGSIFVANLMVFTRVPFPLALIAGLIVSAGFGLIIGLFLLRFFHSSRLFITVASVTAALSLSFVGILLIRLPFFPPFDRRSPDDLLRVDRFPQLLPFQGWHFHVGSLPVRFGFPHVFAIELALLALVSVGVFLRWTRAGVAVRAMAQNPERAALLGIGVGGLSLMIWVFVGLLDGAGVIAARAGSADLGLGTVPALLYPLTAAAIGRFRSLPAAIYGALMLGIFHEAFKYSYPKDSGLFAVILLVIVGLSLLLGGKSISRAEVGSQVAWSATDEPRPVPKELSNLTGLRVARIAFIVVSLALVTVFPFLAPGRRLLAGVIFIHAIAVLSLVVLTGWAGQVSIGQFGIVAVGSVVGGALTTRVGISFWLAVPMTVALCAGIAVIVGLPALRIRGLFLMVTTFGFAVAVHAVIFDKRYFSWLLPESVNRPTLFFFNFDDDTSMYFLTLAALALAIVVVINLRRSRVGRMLIALRESEANVQSFGISPLRAKLLAFAISGALAGFAGVVFAHQQRGVAQASFTPDQSVFVFVEAVIGGISSPGGALLGTAYIRIVFDFVTSPIALAFFQGLGPLAILFVAPGGFISVVNKARDSVLRVVAQRRQIIVPSLFADYDPEILAKRLIPLAEPETRSGLAALPHDRRFAQASVLYKGRGVRIVDRLKGAGVTREGALFGAAARSALEAEFDEIREPDPYALPEPVAADVTPGDLL
jgi:branched-chain amino acid transport system permease protein